MEINTNTRHYFKFEKVENKKIDPTNWKRNAMVKMALQPQHDIISTHLTIAMGNFMTWQVDQLTVNIHGVRTHIYVQVPPRRWIYSDSHQNRRNSSQFSILHMYNMYIVCNNSDSLWDAARAGCIAFYKNNLSIYRPLKVPEC